MFNTPNAEHQDDVNELVLYQNIIHFIFNFWSYPGFIKNG